MKNELQSLEPFDDDTALCGPETPQAKNIEDLIRYCLTVRKRFGKTCVSFRLSWGGSALWALSDERKRIATLEASNKAFADLLDTIERVASKNGQITWNTLQIHMNGEGLYGVSDPRRCGGGDS